jgi:hypothetical protein
LQRRLRKDTPMLRVHQDEPAREELMLDLDEIAARELGGCSPRLSKPKYKPTSRRLPASETIGARPGGALRLRQGARGTLGSRAVEVKAPRQSERESFMSRDL